MNMNRKAFTLIELLVVIAIIAILAAILFPVFARVRAKAHQTQCLSNMKQLGMAVRLYASDYDSTLPTYPIPGNNNWWADPSCYFAGYVSNRTNWSYNKVNPVWFCPSQESQGDSTRWPGFVWEGIVANAGESYWNSWMGWVGKPMNKIRSATDCILWSDGIGAQGLGFSWNLSRSEANYVDCGAWYAQINPMSGSPVGTCPAPAMSGLTADPPYWPAQASGAGYPESARNGYGIYVGRHNGTVNCSFLDGHAKSLKMQQLSEIIPITNKLNGGVTQNYVYRYLQTN